MFVDQGHRAQAGWGNRKKGVLGSQHLRAHTDCSAEVQREPVACIPHLELWEVPEVMHDQPDFTHVPICYPKY